MFNHYLPATLLLLSIVLADSLCKTTPHDTTWPTDSDWTDLNQSVGGALIQTRPVASSCYDGNPFLSALTCDAVDDGWFSSAFHASLPESIDYPFWANNSCVPPSDYAYKNDGCILGGLPEFILNATTAEQVATAVKWASARNIRIIAKGTGHDLNGRRSSGAYALSIWTHQLQSIKLDGQWPRPSTNLTDNVAILGSGNNWARALEATAVTGRTLVSGQVKTVGLGGFIGGGGHGPLSSHYGLAADQALQATVVTTTEDILVANEAQNQDLLWAIRGGGPGLYGIITEFILRTHPTPSNVIQTTLSLSMTGNDTGSAAAASWDAMALLSSSLPDLMDAGVAGFGNAATSNVSPTSFSGVVQGIRATFTFFGYNTTANDLLSLLNPIQARMLQSGNGTLSVVVAEPTVFSTYLSFVDDLNDPATPVAQISLISSRLLGRSELTNIPLKKLRSHLQDITKSQVEGGTAALVYGLQGGLGPRQVEAGMRGALNPAWRNAYIHLISSGTYINTTDSAPQDALATAAAWAEEKKEAVWRDWAPGTGAYINEANPFNNNFQEDFYGGNYDRLLEIKDKYDPTASLYVRSGVGSHKWDYNLTTGKLCRK
ncbi:FAD-dependent monooxygenase [Colletotrichum phormii]|uniref:FAD-dependent monooxygenase n=1 Tax=Colletotrichum phormii TaxID=359342 RepID=A0AAJ0EFC4_9PEZI|nr:FAD-dependent monooxygenase [Colletotrichum phormii]KAK1634840.1 FAD-dependent monooxygenase [Colletotrichum phormii]